MVKAGSTIGISVTDDDVDDIEAFDEFFEELCESRGETYSRAEQIKHAMRMYQTVMEVFDELPYDVQPEPTRRHFVGQALRNEDVRQAQRVSSEESESDA